MGFFAHGLPSTPSGFRLSFSRSMARGRNRTRAASVTLFDFFVRPPLNARTEEAQCSVQPREAASKKAGSSAGVQVATGFLPGLPTEVVSTIWAFSGPRRCCAVRQASVGLAKLCPCDRGALKQALCLWALSVIDMSALRPTGDSKASTGGGPGTASKLGRRGDFTAVTDGAGHGFVRGPALVRCTQRWRLRARAAQLRSSSGLMAEGSGADVSLHDALRSCAAHLRGNDASGVGWDGSPSIHFSCSIWDVTEERPSKRRRVGEVSSDSVGTADEADAASSGFFAVRRWDALMDSRVPWRLRAAALVYHHHNTRGCIHTGMRKAAAEFIQTRTRGDERLRSALLDPIDC